MKSRRLIIPCRISASSTSNAVSSNSFCRLVTPILSASGAKISIVSRAMRRLFSFLRMKESVRMLCVRSASLTRSTLTSSLIASSNFRKFSACAVLGEDWMAIRDNFVTPSTNCATSVPNCSASVGNSTPQSSTVSCNRAVMTVSTSRRISMSRFATATGCVK